MSEISTKVKRIISEELMDMPLAADLIERHHNLSNDLACDSLNLVCIAMEIEKEFGIVVNDSEIELIETVGELIELVEKSLKGK